MSAAAVTVPELLWPGDVVCASCGARYPRPTLHALAAVIVVHLNSCPRRRADVAPRILQVDATIEVGWPTVAWGQELKADGLHP